MEEISDKKLFIVTIIAIILSITGLIFSIIRADITGASSAGYSDVNVTIGETTDITIWRSTIEFRPTKPGETKNSYNFTHVENCYAGTSSCGFNLTNEGNVFINITIQETSNLFSSGNFSAVKHFTYNVTMKDPMYISGYGGLGSCSTGYSSGLKGPDDSGQTGQWRAVPRTAAEVAICYLNYTNEAPDGDPEHRPDIAVLELNITVPDDESVGEKSGSLTFTAALAE